MLCSLSVSLPSRYQPHERPLKPHSCDMTLFCDACDVIKPKHRYSVVNINMMLNWTLSSSCASIPKLSNPYNLIIFWLFLLVFAGPSFRDQMSGLGCPISTVSSFGSGFSYSGARDSLPSTAVLLPHMCIHWGFKYVAFKLSLAPGRGAHPSRHGSNSVNRPNYISFHVCILLV